MGVIGWRLAQTGDLPPALNASRFPRPVNIDALVFHLRHASLGLEESFLSDVTCATLESTINFDSTVAQARGQTDFQLPPLGGSYEVQEY